MVWAGMQAYKAKLQGKKHINNTCLFIAKGDNRVQLGGFDRRPKAKDETDGGAKHQTGQAPLQGYMRCELGKEAYQVAEAEAHSDADDAADVGQHHRFQQKLQKNVLSDRKSVV